jgi:hypothetical protein
MAKKMFKDITEGDRPSYYVITPDNDGFWWAFQPLANPLAEVVSLKNFDFVGSSLNVTVQASRSLYAVSCTLAHTSDSSSRTTLALTAAPNNYWNGVIDMSQFSEGLFDLFVAPLQYSSPVELPRESGINGFVYHFSSLPQSQVHLGDLIRHVALPGAYHVKGVNITTARQLDLLNRAVEPPLQSAGSNLPALHMFLIAPFIALSFGANELSSFILLLVVCPLTAMYWIGVSAAITQLLREVRYRVRRFGISGRDRRLSLGFLERKRWDDYRDMIPPFQQRM